MRETPWEVGHSERLAGTRHPGQSNLYFQSSFIKMILKSCNKRSANPKVQRQLMSSFQTAESCRQAWPSSRQRVTQLARGGGQTQP